MIAALIAAAKLASSLSTKPGKLITLEVREDCLQIQAIYRDAFLRDGAVHAIGLVTWRDLESAQNPASIIQDTIQNANAAIERLMDSERAKL